MKRSAAVLCAGVALVACTVFAPGCGRPPDEAWLQFLGFKQGGSTIGVFKDALREETTAAVDVEFENRGVNVGQKTGTGVLVNRARIDYRMSGYSPPAADYPVNLYLAPASDTTPTKGTLSGFPLAPASLKHWLVDTGAFDDATSQPVVHLTARVTFFGETDEGARLETEGSIGIALTNTGAVSSGTDPVVTVKSISNATISSLTPGKFTVYRTGDLAAQLIVEFTVAGTGSSGDYTITPHATYVSIPALSNSADVLITPTSTSAAPGKTVTLALEDTSNYSLGIPFSASLQMN